MTQQRRRLSVEQRQEEILAAATDIFSTTPYVEVSTQDIADACNVSQGLLFHYFDSKAGLYTAFLKAHSQPLFDDHLDPKIDTPEALRSTLERYLNHVAEHPFVWLAGRRGGAEPTEAINLRIEMRDASVETLCTLLGNHDEHTERAASGMLGFLDAVCIDWVDEGCPTAERDDIIDTAIGALTGALAATQK